MHTQVKLRKMATSEVVAAWMLAEVLRTGYVEQEDFTYQIGKRFGKDFLYDNENGNLAISKTVLKDFRKISGDSIIWSRSERAWRKRQDRKSVV